MLSTRSVHIKLVLLRLALLFIVMWCAVTVVGHAERPRAAARLPQNELGVARLAKDAADQREGAAVAREAVELRMVEQGLAVDHAGFLAPLLLAGLVVETATDALGKNTASCSKPSPASLGHIANTRAT